MARLSLSSRSRLAAITAMTIGLVACSADDAGPTNETPSFSGGGCTNVTSSRPMGVVLTPPHNTNNNQAMWFIINNTGSNIPVTSIGCTHTGGVSACTPLNNETTLLTGMTDFEVGYNVGTANGTVGLTVTLSCGSVSIKTYSVDPA